MQVDITELGKGNMLELLKFAFLTNPQGVKKAFAAIGIDVVDETDLLGLAKLHNEGGDKAGKFVGANGVALPFEVEQVLANVEMEETHKNEALNVPLIWS